jgi:CheY-like chemotaxis protein
MIRARVHGRPKATVVLVVDDDLSMRKLVPRMLEGCGYQVLVAEGIAQAEDHLQQGARVDLLITDVVLSGGTGKQVVEMVRRYCPRAPVIYISGYENVAVGKPVLTKPFTRHQLLDRVAVALEPTLPRPPRARLQTVHGV